MYEISTDAASMLRSALLDSRQRWRDLVDMASDLAFETDAEGRLVFVMPDPALGWSVAELIGRPGRDLLAGRANGDDFNPFEATEPVRRRRVWLHRSDGTPVLLAFAAAPLFDAAGNFVGARGVGADWTDYDAFQERVSAALRRGEVLDHILWRTGQEVLAPTMMGAVLDELMNGLGATGVAVISFRTRAAVPAVVNQVGQRAAEVLEPAAALLATAEAPTEQTLADGSLLLVSPCQTRFGENAGVAIWRGAGLRDWNREDKLLIGAATGVIRMVLEHHAIQQEMAHQARTDPLTGLLNRRAFLEDMGRHMERLDREERPGTLLFADLDGFKPVNDRLGHEAGDQVLVRTAEMLRDMVRPADLVARLGGDEFAVWLDGADYMTAAERAEVLRQQLPEELKTITGDEATVPTVSIGIATREPGSGEPIDSLLRRADQAMYEVKRNGRGHWRVSHEEAR